ncbi:MAG TPA: hypothetical protein VF057_13065 [Thermoanaerobaculia bacterium]
MNIEHELRSALRRKEPSPDFASRVAAKAKSSAGALAGTHRTPWRAVAAALMMTAVLGGWAYREAATQRKAERAREEVLTALRITSEKLRVAQEHVKHIGTENE